MELSTLSHLCVALLFLVIGFSMGKTQRDPEKSVKVKENKEPIDEPDGDLFNDLLMDEQEKRVETIK